MIARWVRITFAGVPRVVDLLARRPAPGYGLGRSPLGVSPLGRGGSPLGNAPLGAAPLGGS